ncbi:MAG TPA: hypothetical protein QF753_20225 [Victivallales bacterium]|nr:hypothetical protein [Victivallales bacterium]
MIIADNVPAMNKFKDFLILSKNYWDKRNHTMVKNIINYAKEFQGKRIIVLTGFEHTYYQRELLEAHKNKNYVLKEYWQYPEK